MAACNEIAFTKHFKSIGFSCFQYGRWHNIQHVSNRWLVINPSTTDASTLEKKVEITITAADDDEAEAANEDERGAIKALSSAE